MAKAKVKGVSNDAGLARVAANTRAKNALAAIQLVGRMGTWELEDPQREAIAMALEAGMVEARSALFGQTADII